MKISDLSHFEEVASEAPNIVGGAVTKKKTSFISADKLVSDFILSLLDEDTVTLLKKTQVKIKTVTTKTKGAVTTLKTGTSKGGKVSFSSASSTSVSA